MKHLEEARSTRDCGYSGGLRITKPNQDRKIRPTYIEYMFGSVIQTERTIRGRHNPRINADTGSRRLFEK